MSTSEDIAQFLASRRARITPEQAGLPFYGARRVPGLRREEVANLPTHGPAGWFTGDVLIATSDASPHSPPRACGIGSRPPPPEGA